MKLWTWKEDAGQHDEAWGAEIWNGHEEETREEVDSGQAHVHNSYPKKKKVLDEAHQEHGLHQVKIRISKLTLQQERKDYILSNVGYISIGPG